MTAFEASSGALSPILTEIIERLVRTYGPERIYLFGSTARGEGQADSDYDIMVVVPDDTPPDRRRIRLAYQALRGTGTAVDVLVWTRQAFEERLHLKASLPSTVVREGKLVYAS
jgi:predicted nucleotidyltransferase